jgi:hypothetical protein
MPVAAEGADVLRGERVIGGEIEQAEKLSRGRPSPVLAWPRVLEDVNVYVHANANVPVR